jgi:hypothetical protein
MTKIEGSRRLLALAALVPAITGGCQSVSVGCGACENKTPAPTPTTGEPNPTPSPTGAPTFEITPPPATASPTNGEICPTTPEAEKAAHEARLRQLDPIYRTQGLEAWLHAAGFTYDTLTLKQDARQIEEETLSDGTIVAAGVQVRVTGLDVPWPDIMTTDQPVPNGFSYQPDPNNQSRLWSGVEGFSGNATLYVDGQNWNQMCPAAGIVVGN